MPVSVATRIFTRSLLRQLGDRLAVARHHRLERLDLRELGLRLDERRHALEAVHHLRVHRMLDPQRAVLVEGGDALGRRHELRAALRRRRLHELDDRLLRRAVVPRGQRIGLCEGCAPRMSEAARTNTPATRVRRMLHRCHPLTSVCSSRLVPIVRATIVSRGKRATLSDRPLSHSKSPAFGLNRARCGRSAASALRMPSRL